MHAPPTHISREGASNDAGRRESIGCRQPTADSRQPTAQFGGVRGSKFNVTLEPPVLMRSWYFKGAEQWLCVEQSRELFSGISGRGGVSNACFHS